MNKKAAMLAEKAAEYHKLDPEEVKAVVRKVSESTPLPEIPTAVFINKLLAGSDQLRPMTFPEVKSFLEERYKITNWS
jgi:hypothetical protein